jgi:hypothetical protein
MTSKTTSERKGYIAGLKLEEAPPALARIAAKALRLTEGEKSSNVDDGSLVAFLPGVSATHKADVLNSTLLAQLAANYQYDREEKPVEWYKFYRDVLENIAWVIMGFNWEQFKGSGTTLSVDEVVIKILAAIATQNDIAIIMETVEALKALSDGDDRVVLFNQESHSDKKGNFQIADVAEVDGLVNLKMGAFYFSTAQTVTSILWMKFSSSETNFYMAGQTMTLNEEIYKTIRADVVAKLGDRAAKYIRDLPLGP